LKLFEGRLSLALGASPDGGVWPCRGTIPKGSRVKKDGKSLAAMEESNVFAEAVPDLMIHMNNRVWGQAGKYVIVSLWRGRKAVRKG